MSGVERIAAPSVDVFLASYVDTERPVVLTGLTGSWPARGWTFESLARDFGATRVDIASVHAGALVTDGARGLSVAQGALGDFLGALGSGKPDAGYVMARLDALPPAMRDALPPIPYAVDAPWQVSKLWLSATGTTTALHFDLSDNVHVVLRGKKRFTLVPRSQSDAVYPRGMWSGLPNGALVDPEAPDLARFPRWREATPMVVELGEGDALFIPSRCWHHVRTVEQSLAVNTWFARGVTAVAARAADWFKRARGLSR